MTHTALEGEFLVGVPLGSILGLLLFNIFICDMFYLLEDHGIANYADDSTPYSAKTNHKLVIEELEKSSSIVFKWLQTRLSQLIRFFPWKSILPTCVKKQVKN